MNYTLMVNGVSAPVYETTVFPPPYNEKIKMPYAVVVTEGACELELTSEIPLESVTIRPQRLNIPVSFDAHTIRISMDKPEKISVEINGGWQNNIVLWVSAAHEEKLDLSGKVYRFGAGKFAEDLDISEDGAVLHLGSGAELQGRVDIHDCKNASVFIDKDAILHGKLEIVNVEGVTLCGFGAICSERYDRYDEKFHHAILLDHCRDVELRDLSLLDSCGWTCKVNGCDNVHVDNINIAGCRGNSDGVDVCGSRNVLVERCFMRTWDDCFVAKAFDTGNLENVTFRDSTLWNDFARPLEVGVEIRAEYARNITFENIDIIHSLTGYPVMGIHHGDRGKLRNIVFSDIRIEDAPGAQIFDIRITNSVWNADSTMGDIDGVTVRNVSLNGHQPILPARSRIQGYSEEVGIRNVTLENLCYHGKYAATLEECHVNIMDFVENVTVKCPENVPTMELVRTSLEVTKPFAVCEDGFCHGEVTMKLWNENDNTVSGSAYLQVSPANMAELPDNAFAFALKQGEKAEKRYALRLQPGKYVFAVQSNDPAVEASWQYAELRLPLGGDIDKASAYRIVNYYGDAVEDVRLAAKENKLILRSEALRDNTFTVYSAAPVKALPGEVKFTVEETDFGEALAVMDGRNGLEAAPQLRCPAEITYVFKNEPKVRQIVKNVVGGQGSDTAEIPFSALDIEDGAKEVWFDVVANLPQVQGYRYAFSMFHSVWPHSLAHMFARADILD